MEPLSKNSELPRLDLLHARRGDCLLGLHVPKLATGQLGLEHVMDGDRAAVVPLTSFSLSSTERSRRMVGSVTPVISVSSAMCARPRLDTYSAIRRCRSSANAARRPLLFHRAHSWREDTTTMQTLTNANAAWCAGAVAGVAPVRRRSLAG